MSCYLNFKISYTFFIRELSSLSLSRPFIITLSVTVENFYLVFQLVLFLLLSIWSENKFEQIFKWKKKQQPNKKAKYYPKAVLQNSQSLFVFDIFL